MSPAYDAALGWIAITFPVALFLELQETLAPARVIILWAWLSIFLLLALIGWEML